MQLQKSSRKRARIEIIPLIDVIFFLLATFVLFTLSLNKTVALDLALPDASSGKPDTSNLPLNVLVMEGDTFLVDNQGPFSFEQAMVQIDQHKRTTDDPKVLISGESRANYGLTIRLLDEVRTLGIGKVSIQTAPTGR